jgi:hypothetical protein
MHLNQQLGHIPFAGSSWVQVECTGDRESRSYWLVTDSEGVRTPRPLARERTYLVAPVISSISRHAPLQSYKTRPIEARQKFRNPSNVDIALNHCLNRHLDSLMAKRILLFSSYL